MTIPSVSINYGYFIELGALPFPSLLLRVFLDGGWIPVLIVLLRGFWLLWIQSRQRKFGAAITTIILAVDVPRQNEQTPKAVEQIFSQLAGTYSGFDWFQKYWHGKFNPAISFELVSIDGYVQFLVHCPTKLRDLVEAAIYAQHSEAEIIEVADYAGRIPSVYPHPEYDVFGSEFVLKKPSAYPLRTWLEFEHTSAEVPFKDPMSATLEAMSSLKRGEQLWLQFILVPTDDSWKEDGEKIVNKMLGKKILPKKGLFDDALQLPMAVLNEIVFSSDAAPKKEERPVPAMSMMSPGERNVLEAIQSKLSKPGFLVKMRYIYAAKRDVFNKGRVGILRSAFNQFTSLNMNGLKGYGPVTPKGDYFWQRWSENAKKMNVLRNFKNRSGRGAPFFVLNIEELATLYHYPMLQVKAPLVKKTDAKKAEPPPFLPTEQEEGISFLRATPRAVPPPMPEEGEGAPKNLPTK